MIRRIQVIKKPRSDVLKSKPISFPPLSNLHLELLEVKKKLKQGLPAVMVIPRKPAPPKKAEPPEVEKPQTKAEKESEPASEEEAVDELEDLQSEEEVEDDVDEVAPEDKDMINELGTEEDKGEDEDVSEDEGGEEGEESEGENEDEPQGEEVEQNSNDPYAGLSPEERDRMEHEEYIWRFRILKKKYPTATLPDYNEHSDIHVMKTSYDRTIRELTLDDNVSSYRMFLYMAFNGIEYAATQLIGFDMGGFTKHQKKMMHKYDRLLVELGERSYSAWGSSLPIEIRLLGMVLFQACVFYLGKVVADKMGDNVKDLFDGIMGTEEKDEKSAASERPRPKMRGPSVNLEDIEKMEKEDKED